MAEKRPVGDPLFAGVWRPESNALGKKLEESPREQIRGIF
jgi:hypothetical protein